MVGVGFVGVFVPGLPTTVFIIIASFCFAKSCPWLEDRLLRNRFFGPSMEIIDGKRPFTRRARLWVLAAMWGSVTISHVALIAAGRMSLWLGGTIAAAAVVGSVCVLLYRRGTGSRNSNPHQN
jgi:uncharacterized membrane protein YbaN (DUF454 family)